jgi:serine/threonine protein phosphatase 1
MRTLAIGDIHGCLDPLLKLWEVLAPTPEDHVIFMGDYVDRGPDSKGVIDFLLEKEKEFRITFLQGNHEEKMFMSHQDPDDLGQWCEIWGGQATLDSYGCGIHEVPEEHWAFLLRTIPYLETGEHIFVHANLEPDVPLDKQLPFALYHKKFDHKLYGHPKPHCSGKIMICGHTSMKTHRPCNIGHALCIDTDPGRGGWLTGLHVESGAYWQTNFDGEVREGNVEE